MKPIFETNRIIIRRFSLDDFEAVFDFGSNKIVNKYTGDISLKTKEEAKDIIKNIYLKDYQKYGYGRWATIYKSTNKIIGFAGLKFLPEFNKTDIGFRFLPEYWHKGIATEVAKPILNYGFNNFNLKEIIGIADPKNIGSCKVLEKIGMTFYRSEIYDETDSKKYNWYQIKNIK